ncbi:MULTISPECIES: zinc ABC transporter permease AztB [unclassified Microbacterium]|uniref:zinc ABC transporter permease AztB n=1 Tax=unclassified Microbacterium TaxID=2609290 RepID=UPI0038682BC0
MSLLLLDPFAATFVQRAFLGGALVAIVCGVVGTWVVLRGMAFLGEAMAHGMLPGVAVATLTGFPPLVGAALSAAAMSLGVGALQRRGRLSADTSIGLLFVASLSLGVIVISASRSFATDASAILFGDILAIEPADIVVLAVAVAVTLLVAAAGHRSFVALTVDPRQAQLLGLRPRLAHVVLVGLVTLAVVSAYQAVGSLLVVGMLLGPAVAASAWTRRIVPTMVLAAGIGVVSVGAGLLLSWHLGTAAGATVAFTAICSGAVSTGIRALGRAARVPVPPLERTA